MKLDSFKEILLKKIDGDPQLKLSIVNADNDFLLNRILESLEKMATPKENMGLKANAAIVAMAKRLTNKDVAMVRDALGHHMSHYKAARKAGDRKTADMHLNKLIPMMHLIARIGAKNPQMINLDYVPGIRAWELNYTRSDKVPGSSKYKEDPKGLRRRPANTVRSPHPEDHPEFNSKKARSVPDYRYLEMPPHPHLADEAAPHTSGYPFELTRVGPTSLLDQGHGFLNIKDIEGKEGYVPHAFDHHPIHELADMPQDKMTPEKMSNFVESLKAWHKSPHSVGWMQEQEKAFQSNPENFRASSLGQKKPTHIHEHHGVSEHEPHVKDYVEKNKPKTAPVSVSARAPEAGLNLPPHLLAAFKKVKGDGGQGA
jgi:hypothetical protein